MEVSIQARPRPARVDARRRTNLKNPNGKNQTRRAGRARRLGGVRRAGRSRANKSRRVKHMGRYEGSVDRSGRQIGACAGCGQAGRQVIAARRRRTRRRRLAVAPPVPDEVARRHQGVEGLAFQLRRGRSGGSARRPCRGRRSPGNRSQHQRGETQQGTQGGPATRLRGLTHCDACHAFHMRARQ